LVASLNVTLDSKFTQKPSWSWLTVSATVVLFVLGIVLETVGAKDVLWLDTERPNELWRLLTGHWVHTDYQHLLSTLLFDICLGMASVSLWFWAFAPTQLYCGLSGVLNALLVIALGITARTARETGDRLVLIIVGLVAIGAAVKIISELMLGYRWVSVGDWQSAPGAHAAGALAGLLYLSFDSRSNSPVPPFLACRKTIRSALSYRR